jgi:DNA-binding PadR family transcriptional regulator
MSLGPGVRTPPKTIAVLAAIAERPMMSNSEVAQTVGAADPGQISRLLARLRRLGLVVDAAAAEKRGERKAWCLTACGEQLLASAASLALAPAQRCRYPVRVEHARRDRRYAEGASLRGVCFWPRVRV